MTKKHFTNKDNIQAWSSVPQNFIKSFGEEGDFNRQYILTPVILKLLGDIKGKKILDVGSGTGYLTRKMAKLGAKVTGLEPADSMIVYAQKEEIRLPLGIEYLQEDLCCFEQKEVYDLVVANMVYMDIPDYKSAFRNSIRALKPGGYLVFSISHPCFEESSNEWEKHHYIKTEEYFQESEKEERFGHSFHRPLSAYLNLVCTNGCSIEEVIEPKLDEQTAHDNPGHDRDVHVPSYFIVKAQKKL